MNMYHSLVLSISFLSLLFIKPHVCTSNVSKNVTGFSLKLIHRDSPESPLYPGRKLTFHEKLSRYSAATYARASYLSRKAGSQNLTANAPSIGRGRTRRDDYYYYNVQVNIGNPPVELVLLLDTGSDFTWTQCLPCENCYAHTGATYDSRKSKDFRFLTCSNSLCKDILDCRPDNKCHYQLYYGGGSATKGVAMQDRFLFPPIQEAMVFQNLVMGCSTETKDFSFEQSGIIGGILGMSTSEFAFPSQLKGVGGNIFSYCLSSLEDSATYLQFGSDIVIHPLRFLQTAPFLPYKDVYYYGLNLEDISINGEKINFPRGTFAQRKYGAGGCFIDTGAPLTMIDKPAFDKFITEYEKFFLPTKLVRNTKDVPNPNMYCYYDKGIRVDQHPYVGFHLRTATYWIQSQHLIDYYHNFFCLMIQPGDRTIIGAWQQRDMRIIYDLRPGHNELKFAFEDCDKENKLARAAGRLK